MWIILAIGSAVFAGLAAILAKCGLQNMDSIVATAYRTVAVLLFTWMGIAISGSFVDLDSIDERTWLFLILSGLTTGASWLCYFRALQLGNVNKVVPVDKTSNVIAIFLAIIILGEMLSPIGFVGVALILIGTMLMIEMKDVKEVNERSSWLLFAIGSAVFAALTSTLGKIGVEGVDPIFGTGIRITVVVVMTWAMIFLFNKKDKVGSVARKDVLFIILFGIVRAVSWICFFCALKIGPASIIVPIDKLSILVTVLFSYLVFKEKLSKKSAIGLAGIVAGTLLLLV